MIGSLIGDLKQYWFLLIVSVLVLVASYSVYLFLDDSILIRIGGEDNLFEYMSSFFFLLSSISFAGIFKQTKNIFFLLLAIVLFVGCGEEISWGQRIFDFGTPEYMKQKNVQGETTLHNIEILNSHNFDNTIKAGWRRVLTVDFLYKLFCVSFGGLLPVVVFYVGFIRKFALKINLPIPPFLLGSFFVTNWLTFKITKELLLPSGRLPQYYANVGEISEFVSAAIFFILALAFYKIERNKAAMASSPVGTQ